MGTTSLTPFQSFVVTTNVFGLVETAANLAPSVPTYLFGAADQYTGRSAYVSEETTMRMEEAQNRIEPIGEGRPSSISSVDQLLDEASKSVTAGDLGKGITLALQAMELDPTNVDAQGDYAFYLIRQFEQLKTSGITRPSLLSTAERAIRVSPCYKQEHPKHYQLFAQIYLNRARIEENASRKKECYKLAYEYFQRAGDADSERECADAINAIRTDGLIVQMRDAFDANDTAKALEHLHDLASMDMMGSTQIVRCSKILVDHRLFIESRRAFRNFMDVVRQDAGQLVAARMCAEAAVSRSPDDRFILWTLGHIYLALSVLPSPDQEAQAIQAANYLKRSSISGATFKDPKGSVADALEEIVDVCMAESEYKEALIIMRALEKRDPGNSRYLERGVNILCSLSTSAEEQQQFKNAEQYLDEALKCGPLQIIIRMQYTHLLKLQNKPKKAKRILDEAITAGNFDNQLLTVRIGLALSMGQMQDVRRYLDLLSSRPKTAADNYFEYYFRGVFCDEMGVGAVTREDRFRFYKAAKEWMKMALTFDPNNEKALSKLRQYQSQLDHI